MRVAESAQELVPISSPLSFSSGLWVSWLWYRGGGQYRYFKVSDSVEVVRGELADLGGGKVAGGWDGLREIG